MQCIPQVFWRLFLDYNVDKLSQDFPYRYYHHEPPVWHGQLEHRPLMVNCNNDISRLP